MEEPEYYRAIGKLFKKLRQRKEIEKSIDELEECQELIDELKDVKTVGEFLDRSRKKEPGF